MPTIKYTGTQMRWSELPFTGKQSTWSPGQQEERPAAEVAALMGTGKFASVGVVPGDGNSAAGSLPIIVSDLLAGVPSGAVFARSGAATEWDASGALVDISAGSPRVAFDQHTRRAMGLRFAPAAQQYVRNQDMAGAVAGVVGSGGVWPTNWHTTDSTAGATWTIIGTIVRNGITCLRVRLQATTAGAATFALQMEKNDSTNPAIAAAAQTWIASAYLGVSAGAFTGVSAVRLGITERTAAGTFQAQNGQAIETSSQAAYLAGYFGRIGYVRTLSGGSTARVAPNVMVVTSSAQTIDLTLDIGLPEIRQAATLTQELRTLDAVAGDTLSAAIGYGIGGGVLSVAGTSAPFSMAGVLAQVDDGSANNRVTLRRTATGDVYCTVLVGGSSVADFQVGRWPNDTQGAAVVRWGPQGIDACLSGGASKSAAAAGPARITTWRLGSDSAGASQWGGTVSAVSLFALDTTGMQARTVQPLSVLAEDFFRADGVPAPVAGGAYVVVPYTTSASAVREPVISSGFMVAPSAASESSTGVTAAYLGYDLAQTPARITAAFDMADGATAFGNVTLISTRLGLGSVANITGGSLHNSITDASYIFGYFDAGSLVTVATIAFARIARDGTIYQAGVRHLGGGMFLAELPDGRSVPIYSPETAAKMGRFCTAEIFVAKNGATLGVFPRIAAWAMA